MNHHLVRRIFNICIVVFIIVGINLLLGAFLNEETADTATWIAIMVGLLLVIFFFSSRLGKFLFETDKRTEEAVEHFLRGKKKRKGGDDVPK